MIIYRFKNVYIGSNAVDVNVEANTYKAALNNLVYHILQRKQLDNSYYVLEREILESNLEQGYTTVSTEEQLELFK